MTEKREIYVTGGFTPIGNAASQPSYDDLARTNRALAQIRDKLAVDNAELRTEVTRLQAELAALRVEP